MESKTNLGSYLGLSIFINIILIALVIPLMIYDIKNEIEAAKCIMSLNISVSDTLKFNYIELCEDIRCYYTNRKFKNAKTLEDEESKKIGNSKEATIQLAKLNDNSTLRIGKTLKELMDEGMITHCFPQEKTFIYYGNGYTIEEGVPKTMGIYVGNKEIGTLYRENEGIMRSIGTFWKLIAYCCIDLYLNLVFGWVVYKLGGKEEKVKVD